MASQFRQRMAVALTLLAGLLAAGESAFGGPRVVANVDRDETKLVPAFRRKVAELFRRMRALGFKPFLWEAYRTPERAAQLAAQGVGIKASLHTLGCAVDIVDAEHFWDASPAFWEALGREAKALGLTWGGDFRSRDVDHVQAVSVAHEPALRSAKDPASFVAEKLG